MSWVLNLYVIYGLTVSGAPLPDPIQQYSGFESQEGCFYAGTVLKGKLESELPLSSQKLEHSIVISCEKE